MEILHDRAPEIVSESRICDVGWEDPEAPFDDKSGYRVNFQFRTCRHEPLSRSSLIVGEVQERIVHAIIQGTTISQ